METPKQRVTRKSRTRRAGFTLLELMVVIGILVVLAALITPTVLRQLDYAKQNAAKLDLNQLAKSLDLMAAQIGRYPTTDEGLVVIGNSMWEQMRKIFTNEIPIPSFSPRPLEEWLQVLISEVTHRGVILKEGNPNGLPSKWR